MAFIVLDFFFLHVSLPDLLFIVLDCLVLLVDVHLQSLYLGFVIFHSFLEVTNLNRFVVYLLYVEVLVPLVSVHLRRNIRGHRIHLLVPATGLLPEELQLFLLLPNEAFEGFDLALVVFLRVVVGIRGTRMSTPLQVLLPLRVEPSYMLFLPLAFFLKFEENVLPVVEFCDFFNGL